MKVAIANGREVIESKAIEHLSEILAFDFDKAIAWFQWAKRKEKRRRVPKWYIADDREL